MNKFRLSLLAAALIAAVPVAAHAQSYSAILNPLNGSNVHGIANLFLNGNFLSVNLTATGLEANELHIQHIHGLLDTHGSPLDSMVPTLAQDSDHDNFIELAEGAATYGPVLLQLTDPPGDIMHGFPTAPNGQINYFQTFDLTKQPQFGTDFTKGQLLPLDLREIVIHGLTVGTAGAGTPGEVNGIPGYKVALPISSGEIMLSVAPVPEPETYAMMLAGLGLLGFVRIRRSRKTPK